MTAGGNIMKFSRIGPLALLGTALCLSACGTLYKLEVTAYSDPSNEIGNTYVIVSGDSAVSVRSPEFNVYADQLERALVSTGYRRVPEEQLSSADMAIYISAAVDGPTKAYYQANRPIYETVHDDSPVRGARGTGSTTSEIQQQVARVAAARETPPPEALIGNEELPFSRTVYTRHLSVVAVDLQAYLKEIAAVGRPDAKKREIWSVDVKTTGSSRDLAEVVPVMIAAALPYFGTSTEKDVHINMDGLDKKVRAIKATQ